MQTLSNMGVIILSPGEGLQACGEVGEGRLMEVPDMVQHVIGAFRGRLLSGKHVVVTAGPTREAIDPVRYVSNYSSGRQGYAMAEAALEVGQAPGPDADPFDLPPLGPDDGF